MTDEPVEAELAEADEKLPTHLAWAAVMNDVQVLGKDRRNPEFGYQFRGIDDVMNVLGPVLRKHKVIILPELVREAVRDVRTSRDKPAREVTVTVRYTIIGPTGDPLTMVAPGEAMDMGDKGTPKAMSVAYRTALLQALCLPTEETDPDEESFERADEPKAKPKDPEREATEWVEAAVSLLLTSADLDKLGKKQEQINSSKLATRDVAHLLTGEDRKAFKDDLGEVVELTALAALAIVHADTEKRPVR